MPSLVAAALAATLLAQSDDVSRYLTAAARLYENLEYERALEQLDRAKKLSRGIDDDVTIALYEGVIRADMGQADQSEAAFKTGLFLKPDAKLPVKVSPKVEQEFESVRARVKKELEPILAKQAAEQKRRDDEARKAEEDKKRAEAEAKAKVERENKPPPRVDVPTQETKTESKLIVASSEPQKPDITIVQTPAEKHTPVAPFVLLGVAAAAGGTGAFFGLQSQNEVAAARNANFESDMISHHDSAVTNATAANVLFGVAGAFALGAGIAFAVSAAGE